jgi:predicted acetyltransferase
MERPPQPLELVPPGRVYLAAYIAALECGWSPDTTRDVHEEQLVSIRRDADGFLADLVADAGPFHHADGNVTPRLPNRSFWLWDGEFCGMIGLRYQPGSDELPPYVKGHIGYAVVPWKQRRGYATRALAGMLPVARLVGLRRVFLVCETGNIASRKVIVANGGVAVERGAAPATGLVTPGHHRGYWITL